MIRILKRLLKKKKPAPQETIRDLHQHPVLKNPYNITNLDCSDCSVTKEGSELICNKKSEI